MASSSSGNGSTVDFNTAMENFLAMFPDLSPKQIESVLRKNDGDVENSINDLLKIGKIGSDTPRSEQVQMPSCSNPIPPPAYSEIQPAKYQPNLGQPNCENDEKIALMMQNREFLRYLQSNPNFMRELNSESTDYYSPTRRHETVLSRCKRHSGSWTSHKPPTYINPMDNEKVAIPDGPLVDGSATPLSRLSKKIKSKFPSMESNGVPRPEDIYPNTVLVDYSSGDENFMHRLRNMSRNSQAMFLNLAKKFNVSKKPRAIMPNSYADQSDDFSYDIHRSSGGQNSSKFS